MYDSVLQSALMRSEGDQVKADYLIDCTYFQYYYRCYQYKTYSDKIRQQFEDSKNKTNDI